eukprot:CAMPEP_0180690734 /NCGR_PEP_ID=MMETSP1037_2-20121125/75167_1 /TAXON_ID=632150 /ORGANISM="Azadinium spinosum, Strain 3D9" /LENGTH=78 /DNA_ID=CAMNT_0022721651 /DNA_START=300 /DNA_END=536 /DNA_ORIENTATION=+
MGSEYVYQALPKSEAIFDHIFCHTAPVASRETRICAKLRPLTEIAQRPPSRIWVTTHDGEDQHERISVTGFVHAIGTW